MATQRVKETWISLFTVDPQTKQLSYAGMDFLSVNELELYARENDITSYVHLELNIVKDVTLKVISEPIKALPEPKAVIESKPKNK